VDGNPDIHWSGSSPTCVRYPGPFEITTTGGDKCKPIELKMFYDRVENKDSFTWNLK
jgi:hypothetical protein